THPLARCEAITIFTCWFMGLMWWLGFLPLTVLQEVRRGTVEAFGEIPYFWRFALEGGLAGVLVISLLTAAVGSAMQVVIRARRRNRLSRASALCSPPPLRARAPPE